jgi:hypothetical protein
MVYPISRRGSLRAPHSLPWMSQAMRCAALHDRLMCRAQWSCSSTTLATPLRSYEARRVPPRPRVGNGSRVNLLGTLAVRLLGKPISIIESKCRSLDTLSSGGRLSTKHWLDPTSPRRAGAVTSRLPISWNVQLSTEGWEHVGAPLFQRIRADTPRPPVVSNSDKENALELCLLRLFMSRVLRMDGRGRL